MRTVTNAAIHIGSASAVIVFADRALTYGVMSVSPLRGAYTIVYIRVSHKPSVMMMATTPMTTRMKPSAPSRERKPRSKSASKNRRVRSRVMWSGLHDRENVAGDGREVLLAGDAVEQALERGGISLTLRRDVVLGHNLSLREDHRPRADLLDHVEAVGAEQDHPSLRREHRD